MSAEPIRQFSVEYVSAAGCPAEERFVAGVEGRTVRARFQADTVDVRVVLRITKAEHGAEPYSAALSISGEADAFRELSAGTCDELVSAAALIVALAIDPEATAEPRSQASPPTLGRSGSPPSPDLRPLVAPPPGSVESRLSLGLSAAFGLTSGVGAGVAPLGALGVELRGELSEGWSAGLALRGLYGWGMAEEAAGSARFSLLAARIGVSPYVFANQEWLLAPSVTFDLGRLEARGEGVPNAATESAPWCGPGAEVSLERRVSEALGGALAVGVRAGAMWSLARDYFYFRGASSGPERRVFEQPALLGHGSMYAGLMW